MSMIKEFKEFAMRGNVMDLAVGVVIGAAFGKIVTSLVADVITPLIGLAVGGVDFSDLAITLKAAQGDEAAAAGSGSGPGRTDPRSAAADRNPRSAEAEVTAGRGPGPQGAGAYCAWTTRSLRGRGLICVCSRSFSRRMQSSKLREMRVCTRMRSSDGQVARSPWRM
jgi:hypothetical protein